MQLLIKGHQVNLRLLWWKQEALTRSDVFPYFYKIAGTEPC